MMQQERILMSLRNALLTQYFVLGQGAVTNHDQTPVFPTRKTTFQNMIAEAHLFIIIQQRKCVVYFRLQVTYITMFLF